MTDQLFSDQYAQPVDPRTLVERMPGTVDAPCLCDDEPPCRFPFCTFPVPDDEREAA